MRQTFFFNGERQACWEAVKTYFYGFGLTPPVIESRLLLQHRFWASLPDPHR